MIVSLLYHDVVADDKSISGFSGADADRYKLDRAVFELQLATIGRVVQDRDIGLLNSAAADIGSDALLFTFDDGGSSARFIADLLESHRWRGHFFVTTDYIGKPGFLNADEIRELDARGHVIGSHSCSHPGRMSHCSQDKLDYEWKHSTLVLSNILGMHVQTASVPGGFYTRRVAEAAARAGIEVLFNSEPTVRIQRIEGCTVLGRYSIQRGMGVEKIARIAAGELWPRLLNYAVWNSKKPLKRLVGTYYLPIRKSILDKIASSRLS